MHSSSPHTVYHICRLSARRAAARTKPSSLSLNRLARFVHRLGGRVRRMPHEVLPDGVAVQLAAAAAMLAGKTSRFLEYTVWNGGVKPLTLPVGNSG